jgi:hypothetical protein
MLKRKVSEQTELPLHTFQKFNEKIFLDESIPPDTFTPLTDTTGNFITQKELTTVLQHHFKANKSSGLSKMPLQLLKHLGTPGVECMADFLNASAITKLPPASWRETKVVPLYKGQGPTSDPENYRSIAITPPFAKVFMAVINRRLTEKATELNLHAPTQAGFRAHHSTIE